MQQNLNLEKYGFKKALSQEFILNQILGFLANNKSLYFISQERLYINFIKKHQPELTYKNEEFAQFIAWSQGYKNNLDLKLILKMQQEIKCSWRTFKRSIQQLNKIGIIKQEKTLTSLGFRWVWFIQNPINNQLVNCFSNTLKKNLFRVWQSVTKTWKIWKSFQKNRWPLNNKNKSFEFNLGFDLINDPPPINEKIDPEEINIDPKEINLDEMFAIEIE